MVAIFSCVWIFVFNLILVHGMVCVVFVLCMKLAACLSANLNWLCDFNCNLNRTAKTLNWLSKKNDVQNKTKFK